MDASLLFSGLAALYVPCGPDFWGGADAKMTITFQLVVNDLTSGFPLLVDSQNFVIYDAYSQHTSAAPTYWLDESRDYTMSGFTLYSGNSYEAIVKVFVDGRVTVTGGTCGGQTLAVFSFRQGSIGPHNYNMSGYVHVNSMTIRDLNPDETHPTTILYPSGFEVICPGFPFTLLASDPPGGFGMGTTYWRHDGGPTNVFTSGSSISPPYSGLLEYWSVDRAGNEELPHNSQYIEVRAAPSIPMHVSVGDGAAGLWQPVDLVWGAVAGADLYHLQVDDDPQFGSPVLDVLKSETVEHCTGLATSTTHYWRVRSRHGICPDLWSDWSTPWSFTTDVTTAVDETIPSAYRLAQNNPNPFNPKTAIAFDLPRDEFVTLEIYGADGRRVKTLLSGPVVAGRNEVSWNGTDDDGRAVASGVYFYRIEAGEFHDQSKMTLVR